MGSNLDIEGNSCDFTGKGFAGQRYGKNVKAIR
jgi:hypothetical protein